MQLTEGLNGGLAGLSLLATCWLWAEPAPTAASPLTLQQQEQQQQQLPVATEATTAATATATARIHVFPHPFPLCAFASTQPDIPARAGEEEGRRKRAASLVAATVATVMALWPHLPIVC